MQNFKVSFILRKDRKDKRGCVPVLVEIHLNGVRTRVGATGVAVKAASWNSSKYEVRGNSADALSANHTLACIKAELIDIFNSNQRNPGLSVELIKALYLNTMAKPSRESSFLCFFEDFVEKKKALAESSAIDEKTSGRYDFLMGLFVEFLRLKYNRRDISFVELDYAMVVNFEQFLRIDMKYNNENTLMKKMRTFKTVVNSAFKMGKLPRDPFYGYTIHSVQADRGFLTDEEIVVLMKKKITIPRLELVRDLFIFSCFTGLAYADIETLSPEHIVVLNGVKWIIKNREKTDVSSNIVLLPIPEAILKKYKDSAPEGRLLPILTNQRMNSYLKELADICEIKKNLTFHMARHTFATMATSKGVPIESVSKMLGHTKISTTLIYARITNKKIEHDMSQLSTQLGVFNAEMTNDATPDFTGSQSPDVKGKRKDISDTEPVTLVQTPCSNANGGINNTDCGKIMKQKTKGAGRRGRPPKSLKK